MAAPYNPELDTLEFKIEAALKLYLISAGIPEAQIFTGEENQFKILPAIVCKCHGGPENPPGTNNFLEDVEVCVVSNADLTESDADPFPPHRRLAKKVNWLLWGSMLDENGIEHLHTVLSAQVPELVVQNEIQFEGREITIRERKIITEFRFKMQCYEGPNGVARSSTPIQFRLFQVNGQLVPQMLDAAANVYHTIALLNDGGVLTLQLSDQTFPAPAPGSQTWQAPCPAPVAPGAPLALWRLFPLDGQVVSQMLDPTTGLYHTVTILNDAGTLTLQLSDQGY